jgi:molybdate transport system permease protein
VTPSLLSQLLVSLQIAMGATLLAAAIGLPLALRLARPGRRGRRLLDLLVNLPLALPPTVLGFYLLQLLGRNGPLGRPLYHWTGLTFAFSKGAAILAAALVALPLFVQATRTALEGIPTSVREAAQIDGAGRWALLRYVLVPLALPGLVTGLLLTWGRSLGEFGATLMVAGNIPGQTQTLAIAIYSAVQAGDYGRADLLSILLISLAGLTTWLALRWRAPKEEVTP